MRAACRAAYRAPARTLFDQSHHVRVPRNLTATWDYTQWSDTQPGRQRIGSLDIPRQTRVPDKTRHSIARPSTAHFLFVSSRPTSMNAKVDAGVDDDEKHIRSGAGSYGPPVRTCRRAGACKGAGHRQTLGRAAHP